MTDPTEAIRKAHAAFAALPSATTLSALHLVCKPSALGALLDRLDSAERDAKRYRLMRENIDYNEDPEEGAGYYWHNQRGEFSYVIANGKRPSFEEVIDAALRVGAVGEQKEPT